MVTPHNDFNALFYGPFASLFFHLVLIWRHMPCQKIHGISHPLLLLHEVFEGMLKLDLTA